MISRIWNVVWVLKDASGREGAIFSCHRIVDDKLDTAIKLTVNLSFWSSFHADPKLIFSSPLSLPPFSLSPFLASFSLPLPFSLSPLSIPFSPFPSYSNESDKKWKESDSKTFFLAQNQIETKESFCFKSVVVNFLFCNCKRLTDADWCNYYVTHGLRQWFSTFMNSRHTKMLKRPK